MFEIRDYHYRTDLFAEYKEWAEIAVVALRERLDVVGFWIDEGSTAPETAGSDPFESPIGTANVTWILRWDSKEARDATLKSAFSGADWEAVMAKHPDPNGYVQMQSRFMEAM